MCRLMIGMENSTNPTVHDAVLSQGHSGLCDCFMGFEDLELMREVIFSYLKPYLDYESDDVPLSEKISSHIRSEEIPDGHLERMQLDVLPIVRSFAEKDSVKQIFSSIFGHNSVEVCENFIAFRANVPGETQVLTGWHQDAQTPFIYGHAYWKYFILGSWISLSHATKNNSIEIVRNTERSYVLYPQHYGRIGKTDFRMRSLSDIDRNLDESTKWIIDCQPDQCVFLNSFVFHRSVPNKSHLPRFSIDIRYYDTTKNIRRDISVHPKLYLFKILKSKQYHSSRKIIYSALHKIGLIR